MTQPIYSSEQHKAIIEKYIVMCEEFAKDVSTKNKLTNYLEVVDTIIEYHNNYGKGKLENNWYDWLMIIPINLSVMTNGYFAGLETKRNAAKIRAYKVLLNEMIYEVVDKINQLEQVNE
jgi:hypothetical protein